MIYKGNSTKLTNINLVNQNTNEYFVNILIKSYSPSEREIEWYNKHHMSDNIPNVQYEYIKVKDANNFDNIRAAFINTIKEYDHSREINQFKYNDHIYWFDKATRVGIANAIAVVEGQGETNYTLWLADGVGVTLPIEDIKAFLDELEVYAMNTFNTTNTHIANAKAFADYDALKSYDFRTNYPEIVELVVPNANDGDTN